MQPLTTERTKTQSAIHPDMARPYQTQIAQHTVDGIAASVEGNRFCLRNCSHKAAFRQTVDSRLSPLGRPVKPPVTAGRADRVAVGRRTDRGGDRRHGELALQRQDSDRRARVDRCYRGDHGRDAHLIARRPCLIT